MWAQKQLIKIRVYVNIKLNNQLKLILIIKFNLFIIIFKCQLFYIHILSLFSKLFFHGSYFGFKSSKTFFPWFGFFVSFNS